ncbi:LacI family DNA-binding transcriptional regulator [Virgibacillus salarius]
MTNINDIAKIAGVSVSTVSRVLNNYKYVSEEKRNAVQKVINDLNYTPNKNAIDLIRGETNIIGVILPYNNNQAFDQMLQGILHRSVKMDFSVIVLPTKYDKKKELEYLAMLKNKLLDSIIITSKANAWDEILPFTTYGSIISCEYTDFKEIGCSYIDRYASYIDAFQTLKELGHSSVAFTTARGEESLSTQQTCQAYKEVFGELRPGTYISQCYCLEDGFQAAKRFFALNNKPSAIYANGDEVAGGIYQYAQFSGLKVPEDLAIIGQENQPVGVALGLATVDHHLMHVGEQAFELAIRKSRDKIKIPYNIIRRSSI